MKTTQDSNSNIPRKISTTILNAVMLAVYALIILAGELPTEYRLWGINHLAYLDRSVRILLVVPALLLLLPQVQRPILLLLNRLLTRFGSNERHSHIGFSLLVSTVSVLLFWQWKVGTVLFGDGRLLITEGDLVRKLSSWFEIVPIAFKTRTPLAALFNYSVSRVAGEWLSLSSLDVHQLLFCLAGGVTVFVLLRYCYTFFDDAAERLLALLVALGSGIALFFYGYVEYYPYLLLASLLFFTAAVRALQFNSSSWPVVLLFLLSVAVHYVTILYLPVLILFFLLRYIPALPAMITRKRILFVIAGLLMLFALALYVSGEYQLRRNFLPVVSLDVRITYTMFSFTHLLDYLNGIMLALLPTLLVLAVLLIGGKGEIIWNQREILLLLSAVFLSQLFTFTMNTDLGFARDWDFTAVLTFSAALLVPLILHQLKIDKTSLHTLNFSLVGLVLLFVVPWIIINADGQKAFQRFEQLLELDRSNVGDDRTAYGYENLSIESRIQKFGRGEVAYLAKVLELSDNLRFYQNMVSVLGGTEPSEKHIPILLRLADRFRNQIIEPPPGPPEKLYRSQLKYYYITLRLLREQGGRDQAAQYYQEALRKKLPFIEYVRLGMGQLLAEQGKFSEAVRYYDMVNPDSLEIVARDAEYMAVTYDSLKLYGNAKKIYELLYSIDSTSEKSVFGAGKSEILLGNVDSGVAILNTYLQRFPAGRFAEEARRLIERKGTR